MPLSPGAVVNANRFWFPPLLGVIDSPDNSSKGANGELGSVVGNCNPVVGHSTAPELGAGMLTRERDSRTVRPDESASIRSVPENCGSFPIQLSVPVHTTIAPGATIVMTFWLRMLTAPWMFPTQAVDSDGSLDSDTLNCAVLSCW